MSSEHRSNVKWIALLVLLLVLGGVGLAAGLWMRGDDGGGDRPAGRLGGPDTWSPQVREHVAAEHRHIRDLIDKAQLGDAHLTALQLLKDYPADPVGHKLLGQIRVAQRQYRPALEAFERSLELDPEQPEVHFVAAVMAERLDQLDQAVEHMETAVRQRPGEPKYPMYLASTCLKTGQLEDARMAALQTLKLDPERPEAYATLAEVAARLGQVEMAVDHIEDALARVEPGTSDHVVYTLRWVQLLRRQGTAGREEALNVLHSLPDPLQESRREIVAEKALTYLSLNRPADAGEAWAAWVQSHPMDADAAARAGLAFHRAGMPGPAEEMLRHARRIGKAHHPRVQALNQALTDSAGP